MAAWWENYPWRVIQTNMRETDIVDLDPQRFVEDLISFHANAVLVSFGGTLANYESSVKDHYVNPLLEKAADKDVLKRLVELCHEKGIKVIARTDFSKMHKSVFEKHPDWAYREGDSQVLDINSYLSTCQNGGFQQEFMDRVIEEIITRYKVDGIYCNMGSFMVVDYNVKLHGPCQCENCRRLFKEQTGMELPVKDVPFASVKDPAVAAYQKFKASVMQAQKSRIQALIKKLDPNVAYCSVDYVRQETNTEPGRGLPHWQYQTASNARTIRGCGKSADCASVDFLGFSARETAVTPALQEYRLWQALANFGGIDYFVMGTLDNKADKRAYDRIRKVFAFASENEDLVASSKSSAEVLLVRSSYQIPDPEERGWIRALTELHIPFDETLTASLGDRLKDNYKLIVLPNKPSIPAPLCQALLAYVKAGGKVLSVSKAPARDASFMNLLGLQSVSADAEAYGSYFRCQDGMVVPVGDSCLKCTTFAAEPLFPIMPPQKFGPPEVCYPDEEATESFGMYVNSLEKGKAVFIPWKAGTLYYTEGYDIWFEFMKTVVSDYLGVSSIAPFLSPMVEVTVGKSGDSTLVCLVNGTGHFGTSFFSPVEIRDAVIELPWKEESFCVSSLYEKDNCTAELVNGKLRITVGKLEFFEEIKINK